MKVKPTIAQQKYIDKAASKSKKPPKTQFRKDIEGAKKMIDSRKNYSDEKIMKKFGEAAFNAVSAEQY
tara:strand:- start:149 stop:352 length:204 start_codon:yes stop_codon:yes gene_type:complete